MFGCYQDVFYLQLICVIIVQVKLLLSCYLNVDVIIINILLVVQFMFLSWLYYLVYVYVNCHIIIVNVSFFMLFSCQFFVINVCVCYLNIHIMSMMLLLVSCFFILLVPSSCQSSLYVNVHVVTFVCYQYVSTCVVVFLFILFVIY